MRIVQIIDSLETGGAERMAVNYANALSKHITFSGLVVTRAEGGLKKQVEQGVNYQFLRKRHTLDISAAIKLKNYCQRNKVDIIHAHSTSYFISILVKFRLPKIRIIWHDHNGMSENLSNREYFPLNVASLLFAGIIVVNYQLKKWAERKLHCDHIIYISNFTYLPDKLRSETVLGGTAGKRILMLANLREQKDHFMLIRVAKRLSASHPDWTFHMVGKDFEDEYSRAVRKAVADEGLSEKVLFYGSRNDTDAIIRTSDIAILTSNSEGLPVSLLEYGLHSKPVVVTAVGQLPGIVASGKNGFIVPATDDKAFHEALIKLIDDEVLRDTFGQALYETTSRDSSSESALATYQDWISTL